MEKTLNKLIGDRIRNARADKGKKQADLASAIDSTPALISNIENGQQSIHIVDLYKIAGLLEKRVAELLPTIEEVEDATPSIEKEREKLAPQEAAFVDELRKKMSEGE